LVGRYGDVAFSAVRYAYCGIRCQCRKISIEKPKFVKESLDNSNMSSSSVSSESLSSSQPQACTGQLWEVHAILAERTTGSVNEVLVVWKPDWIPITNVPDGPVLRQHRDARKCTFISSVGKVILPVEPDSSLEKDMVAAAARMDGMIGAAHERDMFGSGGAALNRVRGTPRKSLGSEAKRAAPSTQHGPKQS
jgi:hypothetical protein